MPNLDFLMMCLRGTPNSGGFLLTPDMHKPYPNACFHREEEKLKWLLSDSGRKTAANDLAGVI